MLTNRGFLAERLQKGMHLASFSTRRNKPYRVTTRWPIGGTSCLLLARAEQNTDQSWIGWDDFVVFANFDKLFRGVRLGYKDCLVLVQKGHVQTLFDFDFQKSHITWENILIQNKKPFLFYFSILAKSYLPIFWYLFNLTELILGVNNKLFYLIIKEKHI